MSQTKTYHSKGGKMVNAKPLLGKEFTVLLYLECFQMDINCQSMVLLEQDLKEKKIP